MKHRESTLYTDSLNYDRLYNIGYFFEGGRLVDGDNILTSDWGEYFLNTKEALFNYNVHLTSPKFDLTSDTLHYNTQTKWAEVMGPSNIKDKENNIYTEHAYYNTTTENVRLMDRSVVANKNGRQMIGDSISYDKQSGMMRAFGNVIYDDKSNKNMLTGEYCQYNELTGQAYATDKALLKDYSNITTRYSFTQTRSACTPTIWIQTPSIACCTATSTSVPTVRTCRPYATRSSTTPASDGWPCTVIPSYGTISSNCSVRKSILSSTIPPSTACALRNKPCWLNSSTASTTTK